MKAIVPLMLVLALAIPANAQLSDVKTLTNKLGMKLTRIEPGQFRMGAGLKGPTTRAEWDQRDEDEAPEHLVKITKPFYLGTFEVTNAQYEKFDPAHKQRRGTAADDAPVSNVTWKNAVDFCAWLSKQENQPYRLPTEAEWEYACRAGTTTPYPTGETLTPEQTNFGLDKDGKTKIAGKPVGSYPANPWGLHDMIGNVAEWCLDWHGPYVADEQTDPVGRVDGVARVVRGWSYQSAGFQSNLKLCRSANRSGLLPEDSTKYIGLRVALGEMPATKPLPMPELPLHQQNVKQTPAKSTHDATKPLFINYSANKAGPTIPPNTWGPIFSNHNHFSAVCTCANGDVLAVWYTCVGEADRQLAQAASRLRAGSDRWEPASFFFGVPDVNTHAPVLLRVGARLYHFCTQSLAGWDHASNIVRTSDDNGATWSKPTIMLSRDEPNRLSQPCSAFATSDGTIVVACDGDGHKDERLMLSKDQGKTWQVGKGDMRKSAGGKYVIHPAIAQRADGAILSFLRGPDPMPLLISKDMGDSWEMTDSPFPGIGVGQKAIALKLKSGALALMTVDKTKKLGTTIIVALSLDDGKTWPHVRGVTAPVGGYMSMAQGDDGVVYLIGSRMNFAACNEAWIREGKAW